MSGGPREELAYVLHLRRYRENSLLVDALSRGGGRLSLVARAPARAQSRLGESLQPFRPVQLSFSGRGELFTLQRVEPGGPLTALKGDWLLSGLYVNELLVRLVQRGEGDQEIFDLYARMITELANERPLEPLLRRFEVALLEVCGYGLPLTSTADTHAPVEVGARYSFKHDMGLHYAPLETTQPTVGGATLLALAGETEFEPATLAEAKHFMRGILRHYLGDKPLHARSLFQHGK